MCIRDRNIDETYYFKEFPKLNYLFAANYRLKDQRKKYYDCQTITEEIMRHPDVLYAQLQKWKPLPIVENCVARIGNKEDIHFEVGDPIVIPFFF